MKYNVVFCDENMGVLSKVSLEENSLYELLYRILYDALIPEYAAHMTTEQEAE